MQKKFSLIQVDTEDELIAELPESYHPIHYTSSDYLRDVIAKIKATVYFSERQYKLSAAEALREVGISLHQVDNFDSDTLKTTYYDISNMSKYIISQQVEVNA